MNNPIDLKTAAQHIKNSCDIKCAGRSPFFFITGAGISAPSVPLAKEITQTCKTHALKLNGALQPPPTTDALTSYSYWFEHAYNSPNDRRIYLQDLIKGKAITAANLRLAHLLLKRKLSNLVVTTNFDDLLSRALLLFGQPHILCDHPNTIGRIDMERDNDVQIIHVHGSYWFYDCCNLKDEIAGRAQHFAAVPFDLATFLDYVLRDRSPLVFGYGGWEDDIVMSALKRRLYHRDEPNTPGYNIYWFVYDRNHIAALPTWLRNHKSVTFVAKPEREAEREPLTSVSAKGIGERVSASPALRHPDSKEQRELYLTADEAFDELIRVFDLPTPELFKNPFNFFITSLRNSLPQEESSKTQPDIYSIQSMLDNLTRTQLKVAEAEMEQYTLASSELDSSMEGIRDALRRAQYREALTISVKTQIKDLTEQQCLELMRLTWHAAKELNDNSREELSGYERIDAISAILPTLGDEDQVMLARALYRKGYVLGELGQLEDALAAYDEVERRFGKMPALALQERVARALFNKGVTLDALNRNEEALAAYEEVLHRFGEAIELSLRQQVAMALVNKGHSLGALNRSQEEITIYDEVLRRFGEATDLPLRESVARALVNKGIRLDTLNRDEEAFAAYDEVLRRFYDATEPQLQEQVAIALGNKGHRLYAQNRSEEALLAYDEILRRFGEAMELPLRRRVAMALFNKGVALEELNRGEEALVAYDEIVRRLNEATELQLREIVARAFVNKGAVLGALNRSEEELAAYEEVVRRFGDDVIPLLREFVAIAFVNKSAALCRLNRAEEENKVFEQLVDRFGKATETSFGNYVAFAFNGIGCNLRSQAKQTWKIGNVDKAKQLLLQAEKKLIAALERRPDEPLALGNHAYIKFLLGEKEQARELLTKAIALGGREVREAELKDASLHPLPQDEEFRALVQSIPLPAAQAAET